MAVFQYDRLQGLGGLPEAPGADQDENEDFLSFGNEPAEVDNAPTPGAAGAEDGQPSTSGRIETPWKAGSHRICSPLIRLHNELVDFCSFLSPTEGEARIRKTALKTISEAVTSIWTEATVEPFGSFVTGLYLPTSDLDLVILDSGCSDIVSGLRALAQYLVRKSLATDIQVIAKAKVPIIKFKEAVSSLNFDISFNAANGPQAAEYVRDLMQRLPPMRSLILVLKVFLHQRELNEVYQGGIGSYALLVMVAAFLLLHPSRTKKDKSSELEGNLGVLLLDFLRLYGRSLNVSDVGVSCRKGGKYFYKRDRGFYQYERPNFLAVEDPQDLGNDLAKGSYAVDKVRKAFDFAYQQLSAPAAPGEAILHRVIRLDAVLTDRQVAEPQSPSPEPDFSPGQRRKMASQESPEPSNGKRRGFTGAQRALNGASSDSEGPESYDRWQPKDRREQQQQPEALPESRSAEKHGDGSDKHKSRKRKSKKARTRERDLSSRSPSRQGKKGHVRGRDHSSRSPHRQGWSDDKGEHKLWDSPTHSNNGTPKRRKTGKRERERDRAFTPGESGEL